MPSTAPDPGADDAEPEGFGAALGRPRVEGYRLEEVLGAGAHSTVYLARDDAGRAFALKHWRDADWSPQLRERLQREVAALEALDHPRVARFVELCADSTGKPCVVMERAVGATLAELLEERGALPPAEVAALADELLDALEHLDARDLIHRDLKPANVVMTREGPVLVDFSIVKRTGETRDVTLTSAGSGLGTSAYMAPEQCQGDLGPVDRRTDVYGLGALLFHALCGVPPWTAESGWERRERNPWRDPYPTDPERRAQVRARQAQTPPALAWTLEACLAGRPDDRPASSDAVRAALGGRRPRRPPRLAVVLSLALSVVLISTYVFFDHSSGDVPSEGQTPSEETPMNPTLSSLAVVTTLASAAAAQEPPPPLDAARLQQVAQAQAEGLTRLRGGDEETPAKVDALRAKLEGADDPFKVWTRAQAEGAQSMVSSLWGGPGAQRSEVSAAVWAFVYDSPAAAGEALARAAPAAPPGLQARCWLRAGPALLRFDASVEQERGAEVLRRLLEHYRGQLSAYPQRLIDLTDLSQATCQALAWNNPELLRAALRPKSPPFEQRALESVRKVHGELRAAGLRPEQLVVESWADQAGDRPDEIDRAQSDLYLTVRDGERRAVVKLDDCARVDGRWYLTDSLKLEGGE